MATHAALTFTGHKGAKHFMGARPIGMEGRDVQVVFPVKLNRKFSKVLIEKRKGDDIYSVAYPYIRLEH